MLAEYTSLNAIARMDLALVAFIIMFVGHTIIMAGQFFIKRPVVVMPITETIMRSFVTLLIDRLNRAERTHFALMIRGLIVFFVILVCVTLLFKCVDFAMAMVGGGALSDSVMIALFLSPLLAVFPVLNISGDGKTQKGAYLLLSRSLNRNLVHNDHHGQRRSGIE